jgi:hypothetical protein
LVAVPSSRLKPVSPVPATVVKAKFHKSGFSEVRI